MAYCSVEEAWGAPLSPTPPMLQDQECKKYNEESHPVFTEKFNLNAKESESESTVAPPQSDQFEDSITDPPLRGSLLSGAIPDQTWKYKKENRPVVKEIESKEPNSPLVEFKYNGQIGEKLDKMIEILSKKLYFMDRCCYICCFRNTSDCGFRYVFPFRKMDDY